MPRQRQGSTTSSWSADRDSAPAAAAGGQEMASMYDYLAKIILLGPSGCGKSCLLHRFVKDEWRVLSSQTIGVEFASKIVKVGGSSSSSSSSTAVAAAAAAAGRRKRIKLQLWDTAGTERFRSVSRSYYRGAAGAVLVYDVGNRASLADLTTFLHDARSLASPHLTVVLAGNKLDLAADQPPPPPPHQQQPRRRVDDDGDDDGDARPAVPSPTRTSTTTAAASPAGLGSQLRATVASPDGSGRAVAAQAAADWARQNRIPAAIEVSALSGEGVDELFHKLARTILTKIELGEIDPDDPMSGIQYGDADYYRYDDGSSSIKSGGLTSDGGGGSLRRRRKGQRGGALTDVFRVGARATPGRRGAGSGRCC